MEYQKTGKYFAQVAGNLEAHAMAELEGMGAVVTGLVPRGFRFSCDKADLYRIVYKARLVQRILAPIFSYKCHSEKYLYNQALKSFDWTTLFGLEQSFNIESNVSGSHVTHSLYAGQLLKDAICDRFREKYNKRPDFKLGEADITLNLHLRDNWATISLDLTGVSMHKRGYRVSANLAPLQETLAAALVYLSGWKGDRVLLDPMCGSGTIIAEALMSYCNIPAGFIRPDRGLGFMPDWDAMLYSQIKTRADSEIIPLPQGLLCGSDYTSASIDCARENLAKLPGGEAVDFKVSRFQNLPRQSGRVIITNPPYGIRLGNEDSTKLLYNELGDFLKTKCPDSEAYILCGSKELVTELRLRAHWKKSLKNADLEVKLAKIIVKG
ncbi:MAG: THUMP domain-containing protein [Candidatus Cloacimonetes bacterium]|nr:THUMP domain-containing protein [Candidatus Cloacimonadota bacterium]